MKKQTRQHAQTIAGGGVRRGDGIIARQEAQSRADGWSNVLTASGTAKDSRSFTRFMDNSHVLRVQDLEGMYRADSLMRRIVDKKPDLVCRDPWKLKGDTDAAVWRYLAKRKFMPAVRKALKWANLYGGSIIVMGVDDGRSLDQPLNLNGVRGVEFFRVYDRYSITGSTLDWEKDPNSERFGKRKFFTVYPRGSVLATAEFKVHYSRVLQFDGPDTTDVQRAKNYGWNDSLVQLVYDDVKRFMTGLDDASSLIRDFVQGVLQITDLQNILTGDKTALLKWKQRLDAMDMTRHSLNTMLLDKEETYTKVTSSVAGISDILQRLMDQVCLSADTPAIVLFGKSPGGLGSTGDGEIRIYYDACSSFQRETIAPAVQDVGAIVMASQDYDGESLDDIEVDFCSLYKPTDKETAEARWLIAQADNLYITNQVLSPEEVAESRFGGDEFSPDTVLVYERDASQPPEPPEPEGSQRGGAAGTGAGAAGGAGT